MLAFKRPASDIKRYDGDHERNHRDVAEYAEHRCDLVGRKLPADFEDQ